MPHQESKKGYLSVTEVLSLVIDKPFLRYWFGQHGTQLCEQIKRESQDIGNEVHAYIEHRFINGTHEDDKEGYTLQAIGMVDNFWNKFVMPWEVKPISLEQTYEDKKLKLQGTMDAHIQTNKGEFIADWKTSNSLDKITVPLQLSAYCHLSGLGVWKGVAVRIDKKTDKVEIKEYSDLAPYWPVFQHALKLARYIKFQEV